jgi:phage shock protein A
MAIFNKKAEWDQKVSAEAGGAVAAPIATRTPGSYGIAETIQLMRTLPVEQNGELVVRVVRATLASLNVHVPEIIEDANRKQKETQEKIAAEHAQIVELEKQLSVHRKEIAALEADLKETTTVRDRLQTAEKTAATAQRIPDGAIATMLGTAPSALSKD